MKKMQFLFVILCISNQLFSQNLLFKKTGQNESPFLIDKHFLNTDKSLYEAEYFKILKNKISPDYSFNLASNERDELNYTHKKYQQFYKGLRVENAILNIHIKEGYVYLVNGGIFKIKNDKSTAPKITPKKAEEQAIIEFIGGQKQVDEFEKGKLVWAPIDGDFKNEFRLTYKFDIYMHNPLKRAFVYVDAENGTVVWMHNRIHETTVDGSAKTKLSGTQSLKIDSLNSTSYRLHDYFHGNGIVTMNLNNSTSYSSASNFTNTSKSWTDTTNLKNGAYDIHWGTQKTYEYFKNIHNRNSIDNANLKLESYYPYSNNFVNAFWDGSKMTYGEGDLSSGFYPVTSLDVVGHEITHGITQHTAGLVYSGEYGALNESFSDIFGKSIEYLYKPTTFTWDEGKEISTTGNGFRNMLNPKSNGNPDTYGGQYWAATNDVHYNSAIQNLWFYILSIGKTGTNDLSNSYSVTGIGISKAEKIAFRNLSIYLTPYSEYIDARIYSILAASDLYGSCSNELIQTTNAWYAVGVGNSYSNTLKANFKAVDSILCSNIDSVQFINLSTGASSYTWTFGDGTTSNSNNPVHKYPNFGTYTVKLKATNCTNTASDSIIKTNFVIIDSTNSICLITKMPDTGTKTLTGCDFTVVDNGGLSSNYTNNLNSKLVLKNTSNNRYNIHVLSNDIDYSDDLYFYNGVNLNFSNQFNSLSGSYIPSDFQSDSNRITLNFISDNFNSAQGFKLRIQCIYEPPIVNFSAVSTNICADSTYFINQTKDNALTATYLWSFGDGMTSTLKNPVHKYATSGYFNVKLKSCNLYGCDSLTYSNYIYNQNNINICGTTITCNNTYNNSNCNGVVIDNGGSTGNYSNNCNATYTFYTNYNKTYKIKFTQFKLAIGDTLSLYDGYSTTNLVGSYTGNTLPKNGLEFTMTGSQFMFIFKSNATITDSGFIFRYYCVDKPLKILNINVSDSASCYSNFSFNPSYSGSYNSVLWDFGDGTSSNNYYAYHTYLNPGIYTIKLIMCNNLGCDTMIKPNFIQYDTSQIFCANIVPTSGYKYANGSCQGYIVDEGRLGNYKNNANGNLSITNYDNSNFKYRFLQLKLKPNDTLFVYDYYNYTLLAKYSGTSLPNNGNYITTTSSSLRFNFISDGSLVDSGFIIEYQCIEPLINASFKATDSMICDNTVYLLSDNNYSSWTYTWDFGDGNTTTNYYNSTNHYYTDTGIYTIKLKICSTNSGLCDSVTKTNYIQYLPSSNFCLYTVIPANNYSSVNKCYGFITDDGNINSNYSNNSYGQLTVQNFNNKTYNYRFKQLKIMPNDTLYVYDYNTYTIIGRYSGNSLPNNGNFITTTTNQLMFKMQSNSTLVDSGFIIEYQCEEPAIDPQFYSYDTILCDGYASFYAKSTNFSWTYLWDFGDGTSGYGYNVYHLYSNTGLYTVKLKICNSLGICDSIIKTNYINFNPSSDICLYDVLTGYQYINKCKGILIDDGGLTDNYTNNKLSTAYLSSSAYQYRVKFSKFKLSDNDYLILSDGNSYYQIFNGTSLPNNGNYIYLNYNVTVQLSSNSSGNDSGFVMNYECYDPYSIEARFTSSDSNSCGKVKYINQSSNADTYEWNFGDGNTSNEFEPTHIYLTDGNYTPSLRAINTIRSNQAVKTNFINVQKGTAKFTSKDTLPTGNITLTNTSTSMNSYKWYLDNIYKTTISNFKQNVSTAGYHKIKLLASNTYCIDSFEKMIYFTKGSSISNPNQINYIALYPNPTQGNFTINILQDNPAFYQCSIVDLEGKIIRKFEFKSTLGGFSMQFDLSDLPTGIYWMWLNDSKENHKIKFEINK